MISHSYRNYAIEQRYLHYVPGLNRGFRSEEDAHRAIDRDIATGEAVMRANERQNEYWKRVGGRTDGVTEAVGFNERMELAWREKERAR